MRAIAAVMVAEDGHDMVGHGMGSFKLTFLTQIHRSHFDKLLASETESKQFHGRDMPGSFGCNWNTGNVLAKHRTAKRF